MNNELACVQAVESLEMFVRFASVNFHLFKDVTKSGISYVELPMKTFYSILKINPREIINVVCYSVPTPYKKFSIQYKKLSNFLCCNIESCC